MSNEISRPAPAGQSLTDSDVVQRRVPGPPPTPPEQRFWKHLNKDGDTDCWLWTGYAKETGYGVFWRGDKRVYAHRFSYEMKYGEISPGQVIDHICHTRLCVNPRHLRPVDRSQNAQNREGLDRSNTSGYRNVYWLKDKRRWKAEAVIHGKRHYIGKFRTAEEANQAAIAWRRINMPYSMLDRIKEQSP